ncbi:fibro-slime domain-containing protein [Fibrobacter sp. UWB12]|nr:fibro-slime domain-containing protein [Fibrobacter sp. UWB12]
MRHLYLAFCVFGAFASSAFADLTVYIQSNFKNADVAYTPHLLLNSGKPDVSLTSSTMMQQVTDARYSFTLKGSLSDFKASDTFSIVKCNNADCLDVGDGVNFNVRDFFEGSNEAWIYVDETTGKVSKSFAALESKIVWFKSPWGNKALPQMIFEQDTLLMHPSEDTDKCGWFYAPISAEVLKKYVLHTAHFNRYNAPWMSVPEDKKQIIDLENALKKDTVYVDGTLATPSVSNKAGTAGECFDRNRVLHVYNPWRNNSVYRDSTVYLTIDGVWQDSVAGTDGKVAGPALDGLAFDKDYKYWLSMTFPEDVATSAAWHSADAKVQITRSFKENIKIHYFSDNKRPVVTDFFPSGVYEAWFFTSSKMEDVDISYAPLERKIVRLLSPWKNTPTSFVVDANNDIVKMSTFSNDTCGWFEGVYYKHAADWKVYFKQSFGLEKYDMTGVIREGNDVEVLVNLDSLMSKHDTAWVYPSDKNKSYSRPNASSIYPVGRLGECPRMKISARLIDWASESYHDSIDIDFGRAWFGNKYTRVGNDSTCNTGEKITGMVQQTLVDGYPARVDSTKFPWNKCAAGHEIDKWFKPEVVAIVGGKEYTNAVCKDIPLELDDEGFWYADYTNESGNCNDPESPGFFFLDDFEYLDSAKTVKNPKFDWIVINPFTGHQTPQPGDTCFHNYGFAMSVSASFKYVKGQYFEFRGDDDVWVFINNRLVVDIGGIHDKVEGAVDLDTLNLKEGREYPFHIFYAERQATGSNFKMRTSINLQKQNTYLTTVDDTKKNDITGILKLKMDAKAISCDPNAKIEAEITEAPSVFYLDGGNLSEAAELAVGLNFGGILINEDRSSFNINIDEIVKQRSLAPGNYVLFFYLETDMSLNDSYEFVIPEYPKPQIAFVDVFNPSADGTLKVFDPTNKTLRGETVITGKNDTLMTHVPYPEMKYLEIMVTYMGNICTDCLVMLDLKPTDARVAFYNEMDQQINTIETDETGVARFYVVGEGAVSGASFSVVGISGVENALKWDNINFKDPEVPLAKTGSIYDRNGDGIADSIFVPFEFDALREHDLDAIAWNFGSKDWHEYNSFEDIAKMVKNDSTVVITAEKLIDSVYTGESKTIVDGNFRYHYIYMDEASGSTQESETLFTKIQDKIGAIMLEKPMLKIVSDKMVKVTIQLSEGCDNSSIGTPHFIELRDKNDNFVDPSKYKVVSASPVGVSDFYDLMFQKTMDLIVPEVGFKIRLIPGLLPDLNGNTPHENNPWRRIEGEQPLETERPKVVTVNPGMFTEENPWPGDTNDVIPIRVDENLTIKEIIEQEGLPGVLVKFQLNDYATTQVFGAGNVKPGTPEYNEVLSKVKVKWDIEFFSSLGQYVNWVKNEFACNDKSIFGTDCIQNAGNMFFKWDAMSDKGRMVGTGVYIAKFKFKIFSDKDVVGKGEETFTFGIRRNDKYATKTKKIK